MGGLPANLNIAAGILRCRDLVQLYYGARMMTVLAYDSPPGTSNVEQIFTVNPARIAYRIVLENTGNVPFQIFVGTQTAVESQSSLAYEVPAHDSVEISRSFLTDLDAVTQDIWYSPNAANLSVSAEEVLLSPLPVDELP